MTAAGTGFQLRVKADDGVALARILLLGVVVSMLMSTSLAIVLEFASYIAFAALPEPRRRFVATLRHPVVIALMAFVFVVIIAAFYGPTSWDNALRAVVGWRRVLLLPLAAAVFDDDSSIRLLFKTLIATCLVGTVISMLGVAVLTDGWLSRGVIYRNYTVQGMTFSLAIMICIAALMRPAVFAGDRLLGNRIILITAIAAMAVDVVFLLEGRSGYVAVIIMSAALVAFLARGTWRAKAVVGLGVLICAGLISAASPHVRGRVEQALREMETVDVAREGSSVGQRTVMWRDTIRMVRDKPIFGVGTGGFQDGYRPYVQSTIGWQNFETDDPHNQFLKIQGEQGLVGLLAFLFFIFRAMTYPAPTPYRELGVAAMMGWCATSLANSHFSTFVEGRLLFFWLGAMLAAPAVINGADSQPRI